MKLFIEKSFGNIEFENSDAKELIKEASFWQTLPNECPKCRAPLQLFYRSPQENDYYGLVCTGQTRHETNFGQYKKGGLYYKNEWQNAYQGVAAERDAEIGQYGERDELIGRINKAVEAIKGLGGETDSYNFAAMTTEQMQAEINALNDQYKRL